MKKIFYPFIITMLTTNLAFAQRTQTSTDFYGTQDFTNATVVSAQNSTTIGTIDDIDTAGDEECLTYEGSSGKFEWQSCGSGGGGSGDLLADGTVPLTADWNAGNGSWDITAVEFKGALIGNASTSTALSSNPSDCSANQFANTIAANGDLSCSAIADADVPNDITINNASTATALSANGANCSAGNYPLGVDASGAVESCTDATTEINSVVNGLGGTGLTCASQSCDVDLGTSIVTGEITDGTILEVDLNAIDTPSDNECLAYNSAGGNFSWETCGSGFTTIDADYGSETVTSLWTFSGTLTVDEIESTDGTTSINNTLSIQETTSTAGLTVNSDDMTGGSITFVGYTADPCATIGEGSIFYNTTSNYMCYCDGTNDLKMNDNTTACF